MTYELLDHTADAKFRAYGSTLEEAFASAVEALTAILVPPEEVAEERMLDVTVTADTHKKLLYDFLDHVIFLMDTEKFIARRAEVTMDDDALTATLHGGDVSGIGGDIKAVTYSEMLVERTDDGWMVQVVVDI